MDILRTVRCTLPTTDTVVCLTQFGHCSVQTYQVVSAQLIILLIHFLTRQRTLIFTLVIMYEDGGNVDAIRTGHTIFTVVTRYILQSYDALCHILV